MKNIPGVLLTNTGTPDSPTVKDVKRYLKSFLSDPKVVRIPKLLWWPLLNFIILPKRSPYSAKLYQNIWSEKGSPLRFYMHELSQKLEDELKSEGKTIYVETGMHYGNPSIMEAVKKLIDKGATELWVLPLYPQYSTSTTETAYIKVKDVIKNFPNMSYRFLPSYPDNPYYIEAIADLIEAEHNPQHFLLFSFHGLPESFIKRGDPYAKECELTTRLIAKRLNLTDQQWALSYQSRFGYNKWLEPALTTMLEELPKHGIDKISVIAPGFSIDCLETLEEIELRAQETFLEAGGKSFKYIKALNATPAHLNMLKQIIKIS